MFCSIHFQFSFIDYTIRPYFNFSLEGIFVTNYENHFDSLLNRSKNYVTTIFFVLHIKIRRVQENRLRSQNEFIWPLHALIKGWAALNFALIFLWFSCIKITQFFTFRQLQLFQKSTFTSEKRLRLIKHYFKRYDRTFDFHNLIFRFERKKWALICAQQVLSAHERTLIPELPDLYSSCKLNDRVGFLWPLTFQFTSLISLFPPLLAFGRYGVTNFERFCWQNFFLPCLQIWLAFSGDTATYEWWHSKASLWKSSLKWDTCSIRRWKRPISLKVPQPRLSKERQHCIV